MEEHLPYFQLKEACSKGGCPLCTLLAGQVGKAVTSILTEQVNNVFFRAKLRSGHGFCNRHAHRLTDARDALGIAVIQKELVTEGLQHLDRPRLFGHRIRCLLCSLERDGEKRYNAILRKNLKKPGLQEAFTASGGLCLPHYAQVTRRMLRVPAWFREYHREQYAGHLRQLERFIGSYNASLGDAKPVLTEAEKNIWRRSVALLHGYRGRPE